MCATYNMRINEYAYNDRTIGNLLDEWIEKRKK